MSQLTPCPSCQRHIRVNSAVCPFCDATTVPAALSEARAMRRAPVQSGVKRAVLFAIGAGLTSAACADGENDESDTTEMQADSTSEDTTEMFQAIYGAPVATSDDSTSADTTSAVSPDDSDTTELAQPVYGAPIETDTSDENTSSEADTSEDSGPIFQPVYGAPVIPPEAGDDEAADAGADAASPDASLVDDSDTTDLAQPVYGAPIDTTDDDTSTKTDVGQTWNEPDGGGMIVPSYGAFPAEVE